ncbi:MAG: hypothetical protein K1V80_06420 [Muribaculaceae bacterium]
MSKHGTDVAIGVLSAFAVCLIIAIVAILSFGPAEGERLNYQVDDNETAIENTMDYGMRIAPESAYFLEVDVVE